jgi:hypothetical protein
MMSGRYSLGIHRSYHHQLSLPLDKLAVQHWRLVVRHP